MVERLNTKRLLLESLTELMNQKPFQDITVRMIAQNASTTTRTFYNHFQDKYELLSWSLKRIIGNCIQVTSEAVVWKDSAQNILDALYENRNFISNACAYIGQNDFRSSLHDSFVETYTKWIDTYPEQAEECRAAEQEDILFAVEFFSIGATEIIERWCRNGFQESPEQLAHKFQLCLPPILRGFFKWTDDQQKSPNHRN